MTKIGPSTNVHSAKIHNVGHPPIPCKISMLSTSGIVVNGADGDNLSTLDVGDAVYIHICAHNSQILKIHTEVEHINVNSAQLRYIDPQDKNVSNLDQWFNQSATTSISQPSQKIADEINKASAKHISSLLDACLEKIQSNLMEMAAMEVNNTQQNKLYEALSLLDIQGEAIKHFSYKYLMPANNENDASIHTQNQEEPLNRDELEVIDQTQFEDWLSLETIIKRANEHYYHPLSCLEQRYDKLFGGELPIDQLPISVDNICRALEQGFKHYNFEPELLTVVYRLIDEHVVSNLDGLYQILNEKFKYYGILPDIESQLIPKHRFLKYQTLQNGVIQENKDIQRANQKHDSSPQLMDAVTSFQQLVSNPQTISSDQANNHNEIPIAELVNHLTQLQHDVETIDALTNNMSLQQALVTQTNSVLPQQTQNLISLVDSIFNTVDNYSNISKSLITSFKRLQIPIAKAALIDNNFFSSETHPIKIFLEQMVDLGINSEVPNKPLEQLFEKLITDINENFDQDNSIFERANSELSTIAEQQTKTYTRNTRRIIQTCEGKQQLKLATDTVANEIHQRIKPPQAPQIIVDLIDNGWRELLHLTYLKIGPQSDTWYENLNTIDQLMEWLSDRDEQNHLNENPERESLVENFVDHLEQTLNDTFPGGYRYDETVKQIKNILYGIEAVKLIDVDHAPQRLDLLSQEFKSAKPELNRWFRRAQQANIGDEFSYIFDNSGKKNIKLVWASDDKQHFVFVNNRGQKVLDFDLYDLANELSKGLIPVENKSELPLVERSLYSTIQQVYETLAFKSSHDELTGLLSRKECERILGQAICKAKNDTHCSYCLLYIDIDQFSLVNDLHGHIAGDQQLVEIASLLQKQLSTDTVTARMAGNEFLILLKNQDEKEYLTISEDLRAGIEKNRFKWQEQDIHLTASIGLVIVDKYTKDVIDLVRNAIEACKIAKKNGGNRFYNFHQGSELHTRREKLLSWIDKLDHLLESDKLVLRAQAIVPLVHKDESDAHFEILFALKDDQDNLISPAEFIEAAENYSRMQKVDRWVIDKIFQWLHKIDSGPQKTPRISINLSGNSLNDDQFAQFLFDKLKKYNIPTDKICFEVTETATINNIAEVADFIREIKKIGCKFSLDDFGSGNASYQYLRHLPVDYIKVDGMFVKEIDKNSNDYALVKSINEIAHLMGMKTVAEFVESEEIIDVLKDIGVDYIQGYVIDRPTLLTEIVLESSIPTH